MSDKRCANCRMLYPEEELLLREDNGEWICPDCSGMLKEDLVTCAYDEEG
jgi:hypothetical protein